MPTGRNGPAPPCGAVFLPANPNSPATMTRGPPQLAASIVHTAGVALVPWSRPFDERIKPPKGRPIVTLKDAAAYIMRLPAAQQQSPEWQAAGEAVIMAAEDRGPLMHAHVGMMLALHGAKPIQRRATQRRIGDRGNWRAIGDVRRQMNVRFEADSGLKSDVALCPRSAKPGSDKCLFDRLSR
jgi:hypothetical protein